MGNGEYGQTGSGLITKFKPNFEKIIMNPKKVAPRKSSKPTFFKRKKKGDVKKFETAFSCGAYHCVCVHEGNVYIWGSYQDNNVSTGFSLISYSPHQIPDMTMMQVKQLCVRRRQIFAVVGLTNLPNIRFSCFDPPQVESGTLDGILDFLLQDFDEEFTDTFFLTYTLFLDGSQLLDILQERLKSVTKEEELSFKSKMLLFLEKWVKSKQNYDIFEYENIFEKVKSFIELVTGNNNTLQTKILKLLAKENISSNKIPPSLNRDLTNEIFEMNPREVAEQISLFEQHVFSSIAGHEFLKVKWQKNKDQAQNIVRSICSFNNFSNWVGTTILLSLDEKIRSHRANTWLTIADVIFFFFLFF